MGTDSKSAGRQRKRAGLTPLTALRAHRLQHALSLNEVALRSGLSTYRVSVIERDPDRAWEGEIDRFLAAVNELAAERQESA
jgi:hypothetical protein